MIFLTFETLPVLSSTSCYLGTTIFFFLKCDLIFQEENRGYDYIVGCNCAMAINLHQFE